MRLNQYIASSTDLSRRAADAAIAEGRVSLNGQPAALGTTVALGDTVALDGRIITPRAAHTYVALHKPAGYISSRARQGADPTAYDLLPPEFRTLRLAGRLDRDSSGLLILSDDGAFIQELTHPSADKQKVYALTLESPISEADIKRLKKGVKLTDGPSHVHVITVSDKHLTVSLSEGRNRQLRRTFGALGYTILRLHRLSIGPYQLGDLKPGAWREAAEPDKLIA